MRELYLERAIELAEEKYSREFEELPQIIQDEIYDRAMREINSGLADKAEFAQEGEWRCIPQ